MNHKWKAMMLCAAMLAPAAPVAGIVPATAVHAAAPSISADKTTVSHGSSVTVTGSFTPYEWVSMRVVDSGGNIVVFDAAKADAAGEYAFTFQVPEQSTAGALHVYTGAGSEVASVALQLTAGGSGSGGSGGSGSGGSGGGSPSPAAPSAEGDVPDSIGSGVVTFHLVPSTNAAGRREAAVDINGETVQQAMENGGGKLTIRLDAADAQQLTATLTNDALAGLLAAAGSSGAAEIVTPLGSYELPLAVLNRSALANSLGIDPDQVSVRISIAAATPGQAASVNETAGGLGAAVRAGTVDFIAEAVSPDGKSIPISFANQYVSRTLPLTGTVNEERATGVRFEEGKRELRFVPSVFHTENGQQVATLKRNGNSLYTVIQHEKTFNDLEAGHWGKADVELLASKLIINGLSAEQFGPDHNVTRAEFAAMIVRALGLSEEGAARFSDVQGNEWFAGAAGAAYEAGLISGYEDGTFRPDQQISRQELAMMIYNALIFTGNKPVVSGSGQEQLEAFADRAAIASWAQQAVAGIVDADIAEGRSSNLFEPLATATRAEAAAMMKRLLQHVDFIN